MWVFVLDGRARIGDVSTRIGDVMFLEADQARVCVGRDGFKALATYAGADAIPDLLRSLDQMKAMHTLRDAPAEASR